MVRSEALTKNSTRQAHKPDGVMRDETTFPHDYTRPHWPNAGAAVPAQLWRAAQHDRTARYRQLVGRAESIVDLSSRVGVLTPAQEHLRSSLRRCTNPLSVLTAARTTPVPGTLQQPQCSTRHSNAGRTREGVVFYQLPDFRRPAGTGLIKGIYQHLTDAEECKSLKL